jgi:hypothetical protein
MAMIWITSKQKGWCGGNVHETVRECTHDPNLNEGDRILWDSRSYLAFCEPCGKEIVSKGIHWADDIDKDNLKRVYKGINDGK